MRVLLLHNPTAGPGDHDRLDLISRFDRAGYDVDYCSTKSDRFPEVLDGLYAVVAVAGGDGTVRKVATRLGRRDTPILILPLGTANNIARSLGIPLDGYDLPSPMAAHETLRELDLATARLGDREIVLSEGMGMGALAATMDEKVGKGKAGLGKLVAAREVVASVIERAKPLRAFLTVDGRAVEGDYLFVEALLHAYCGPALRLCPLADSGDGLIDVVLLEEERRAEMAAWVASPENSEPPVRIERGRRVTFKWSRKPPFRCDDEIVELRSSVKSCELRVEAEPLRVVVPRPALRPARRMADLESKG